MKKKMTELQKCGIYPELTSNKSFEFNNTCVTIFVKKKRVPYTLTSIAPNWCYITAVWVAKIDLAD